MPPPHPFFSPAFKILSPPICLIIQGCGSCPFTVSPGLISHPFVPVSVLWGSHLSSASGSRLRLCCGRPDGKPLPLRARDGPSFALFTLGRISVKLALSLLLPSITNSVCLYRVHFPPALAPLCYSKQMIIICSSSFFSLSISLSAVARRDC